MPQPNEYVGILKCQTSNVWPEMTGTPRPFSIDYGTSAALPARLTTLTYDVQRGRVNICIDFKFDGKVPPPLIEALGAITYSIMSLLNLQLGDYLTPVAPFRLLRMRPGGGSEFEIGPFSVGIRDMRTLAKETLDATISSVANVVFDSPYGEKLRVAVELYAAHFAEQQARVRFLLLVMAIESLAKPTPKHPIAVDLLGRWRRELETEMSKFDSSSEELRGLEALSRELGFRSQDSVRTRVRKLFASLPGVSAAEAMELQRRALRLYDKRSTLVHDGYLPTEELPTLEGEARSLLEKVFSSAIEQSKNASSASTVPEGV